MHAVDEALNGRPAYAKARADKQARQPHKHFKLEIWNLKGEKKEQKQKQTEDPSSSAKKSGGLCRDDRERRNPKRAGKTPFGSAQDKPALRRHSFRVRERHGAAGRPFDPSLGYAQDAKGALRAGQV